MIAVGIDPSLSCTGVAVIDTTTGKIIARRVVTESQGKTLLGKRRRIRQAVARTLNVIPARVDLTAIEVPNSRSQFGAQNERMALYWFLVDQMFARGPVVEIAPATRAVLASGNGRASKEAVTSAMRAAFPAVQVTDDNVADALSLAAAAAARLGHPQYPYDAHQSKSFANIAWPIIPTQKAEPSW